MNHLLCWLKSLTSKRVLLSSFLLAHPIGTLNWEIDSDLLLKVLHRSFLCIVLASWHSSPFFVLKHVIRVFRGIHLLGTVNWWWEVLQHAGSRALQYVDNNLPIDSCLDQTGCWYQHAFLLSENAMSWRETVLDSLIIKRVPMDQVRLAQKRPITYCTSLYKEKRRQNF